ncbi:MAG: hypothetical protein GEV09_08635 [Pseudonocardiaceae bacterium]|nr:hypothetical protein [Pseudonocardiaceae bacterium]
MTAGDEHPSVLAALAGYHPGTRDIVGRIGSIEQTEAELFELAGSDEPVEISYVEFVEDVDGYPLAVEQRTETAFLAKPLMRPQDPQHPA